MTAFYRDEGFDRVEVETPEGWIEDGAYKSARRTVRRRMGFYRHVSLAVSVLALLLALDIVTGPSEFWVQWVALIWGIALAVHFLNAFVFDSVLGRDAERRMVERELRKRKSSR